MKQFNNMLEKMVENLEQLTKENAVVAKPISVGDRHVVPLCKLRMGYGGGIGGGEQEGCESGKGDQHGEGKGGGEGSGAGGGARVTPVAVIVVDGDKVRLESLV